MVVVKFGVFSLLTRVFLIEVSRSSNVFLLFYVFSCFSIFFSIFRFSFGRWGVLEILINMVVRFVD